MNGDDILSRILERCAKITIVGGGYVGLPLAIRCANVGHVVTVYDIDQRKIDSLAAGKSYIDDVKDEQLQLNGYPLLCATSDPVIAMRDPDIVIICVPTPLNKTKDPDVSMVVSAARMVRDHTPFPPPERLVVLESTVYPGFTREVMLPELLVGGTHDEKTLAMESLFVAFSPERVDPSNPVFGVQNTPKVVGGLTPRSAELAVAFYTDLVPKVVPVSSCDAAEMAKVVENTFRMVNIALANETALECGKLDLDVWEVIGAAATKPFGFMPFWPGPGVGGHCLSANEWVYFRRNSHIGIDTTASLWKILANPDQNLVFPENLQVLALDESGQVRWSAVKAFSKRSFSGDMVRIKTGYGYVLDVTADHPMLTAVCGAIQTKTADKVEPKDIIPVFVGGAPENSAVPTIDIIEYLLPQQMDNIRVRLRNRDWKSYKDIIYRLVDNQNKYDFIKNNCIPLHIFLEFEKVCGSNFREDAFLLTGRGPSFSMTPAILTIDCDFARLVGYYLSEGCLTEEKLLPRVRLTFGAHEREYISDAHAILSKLGMRWSDHVCNNAHHIRIASAVFGFVLRDILKCGCNSLGKRIPASLLDLPTLQRRHLLGALIKGDGSCGGSHGKKQYVKNGRKYSHQNNSVRVSFFSASENLSRGVAYLMQSLGIIPRIGQKKNQNGMEVTIGGGSAAIHSCLDFLGSEKGDRIRKILACTRHESGAHLMRREGPFIGVPVIGVGKYRVFDNDVFSFEVEGPHTFAAGFGCFVHNCIGLDPHYLAWKLRSLNYRSRFIELAEQINSAMPEHVVRLVVDTLSQRCGKAISGAKVLVLGMAYKPNVSDVRESPAFDIVRLLDQHGAKVRFFDPHAPTVRLENGDRWHAVSDPVEEAKTSDCVLIVTDHRAVDYRAVCEAAQLVVDSRNATKELRKEFPNKIVVL